MEKQTFTIDKISCGHCVASIKSEINEIEGVVAVDGDPVDKKITVEWQSPATVAQVKARLSEIGYPASA